MDTIEKAIDQLVEGTTIKLSDKMRVIPLNSEDEAEKDGSPISGFSIIETLRGVEKELVGIRFSVANDDITRSELADIANKVKSIIGQASKISQSARLRLSTGDHT